MRLKLNLLIDQLEQLPGKLLQSCQNSSFMVQIKWKGSRKIVGFLPKRSVRNCSSKQQIQAGGVVCWNEAFDHTCKLRKADDTQSYKSWIINLEIQEFNGSSSGNTTRILGRAIVDVVEFLNLENGRSIRIPINCDIRGHAILTIKLHFVDLKPRGSTQSTLARVLSLGPLTCTRHTTDYQGKVLDYRLHSSASNKGADFQKANEKIRRSHSLLRLFSLRPKMRIKNFTQDGENSKLSDMPDNNHTEEIGSWEEKRVVSRDGKLELITEIFFASIDQCDEKAAGGNACTVLATVMADWLHKNLKNLPQRRQFDNLVHEGSTEWRKLCAVTDKNNEFSDQHFDLETVIEAKIRNLSVMKDMSYIGFFSSEDMIDKFGFLEGAMSFDNIWNELLCADNAGEGRVYITGWNDHFFVLKVEKDAIYLIDTLGERLFEGCKQAHILKFHEGSMICKRETEDGCQTENTEKGSEEEEKDYHCKGMGCCREYIKEFLAGLPVRELLEHDIQRGLVEKALHQRLQIEFHYTVPL